MNITLRLRLPRCALPYGLLPWAALDLVNMLYGWIGMDLAPWIYCPGALAGRMDVTY